MPDPPTCPAATRGLIHRGRCLGRRPDGRAPRGVERPAAAPINATRAIGAAIYAHCVRRILVYGATGSGKSTLAARIGERLGLPYHSVDDLTWEPGWVPVSTEVQRERIAAICAGDDWVIDSAYGIWVDIPLARADLIVGLDLPRLLSLSQLFRRTLRQVIRKTPTCNGNVETFRNMLLNTDSILVWHFRSFKRKQTRMRAWAADPAMPEVVLLHSRREVEQWVAALSGARQA